MTAQQDELNPLLPQFTEILIGTAWVVNAALVVGVLLYLWWSRSSASVGGFDLLVLLFVPVLGPLLVLARSRGVARRERRPGRASGDSSPG